MGVDELCTVELLSRQFNPSINIFINAATIFDYKRALDKFQIDICKKINTKYVVYLLTHDYLAALFGILERVNIILVHQGVYYMLPKNNAAINNILETIDNKEVFGSLSKILNLPKLPNEGFSLNISNLFANSVYNSNMIYQPNITNNAIDNYIFRLSNAQNTDGRNNVELLSPYFKSISERVMLHHIYGPIYTFTYLNNNTYYTYYYYFKNNNDEASSVATYLMYNATSGFIRYPRIQTLQ